MHRPGGRGLCATTKICATLTDVKNKSEKESTVWSQLSILSVGAIVTLVQDGSKFIEVSRLNIITVR